MATNMVYRYDDEKTRVWDLGGTFAPGLPVKSASSEPGVTLTGSGGYTRSQTGPGPYTISGIPAGGVGLTGNECTVATDGTWEFEGVVSSGATPAPTSTPNNTLVYITSGNALTLASSGNAIYGVVDYPKNYVKVAGTLPVKIGVFV